MRVAVGAIGGALALGLGWLPRTSPEAVADKAAPVPPPKRVATAVIDADRLTVAERFLGEVEPSASAQLAPGEAGRVARVLVREGDRIQRGRLLVELDDRLARAELAEARAAGSSLRAEAAYAQRRSALFEAMRRRKAASPGEIDRERSSAQSLEARGAAAAAQSQARRERVARHRIVAPFDGVVVRRLADPGDWLAAGQIALEMVTEEHEVEVFVRIPARLLESKDPVIEARSSAGTVAPLTVRGTVPVLEPSTRTALVRLEVQGDAPPWLRPGRSVDVVFHRELTGGVVVPRDALVQGVTGVRIVRVAEGRAEPVPVEVVHEAGQAALVRGDLTRGDVVVIRGNERLRPGQPVTAEGAVVPPAAQGSSG